MTKITTALLKTWLEPIENDIGQIKSNNMLDYYEGHQYGIDQVLGLVVQSALERISDPISITADVFSRLALEEEIIGRDPALFRQVSEALLQLARNKGK